jgi:AbrB family transcriptional regulator, transcriptional pleiotropic regulator of transition state genes
MGTRPASRAVSTRAQRRSRTTGIIRHVDDLGRIVIPIEIRKRLGLGEKDPLEISVREDVILLSKPQSLCVFCGRSARLREHRGRAVCDACIAELSAGD